MTGDELPSASAMGAVDVVHRKTIGSTMDEAHALASAGAPAGTLVIADEQTAGRGRSGNVWQSEPGLGIWLTLIERPVDTEAVDVLSIRLGLAIADALEPFADGDIRVKWPNDLFIGTRKLAGILVEARWREGAIDWVAIGVGVNVRVPPGNSIAAALRDDVDRNIVLPHLVPALRAAAARCGWLSTAEQQAWTSRDLAIGRNVLAPVAGTVVGLAANGALRVRDANGAVVDVRSGSLVFRD